MKKLSILLLLILSLSACNKASLNETEAASVLREALSKFLESESYDFDLNFSINQDGSYLEINTSGSNDFSDPENPQSSYESNIKSSSPQITDSVLSLEVLQLGKESYLKLKKAPNLKPEILDTWQIISAEKLAEFFSATQLSQQQDVYQAPWTSSFSSEQRQELSQYLKTHDLAKIIKVYPDTLLDEIPVYQFSAELQSNALKEYLVESARIQGAELSETESKSLEEALSNLYIMLELLVGREDQRIYKVTGNLKYQNSQQNIEAIYRILLSDYGKKLNLKAPSETRSFLETDELNDYEHDLQKMNSPACQAAMQAAKVLDSTSDPAEIARLSQNLREACQ